MSSLKGVSAEYKVRLSRCTYQAAATVAKAATAMKERMLTVFGADVVVFVERVDATAVSS